MNQEIIKPFDCINFDYEFKETLTFISEICETPFVFITHRDSNDTLIITKMGFDFLAIPKEILLYNQNVIAQKTVVKISDLKRDTKHQSNNSSIAEPDFCFFVGLPICDNQNVAVGSICILDLKAKELSVSQFRLLEYTAKQINFKLEAFQGNRTLLNIIKEKEQQFHLFIDNSNETVYEIQIDGVFNFVSKNWTTFLGYEVEEALGKNFAFFVHPEDLEMCINYMNEVFRTGKSGKEIVYRILHKDGYYVWHATNLKFSENKGKPIFIGHCRDITKQIETNQELLKQKEFYEKILDQMPTDVAVFDRDHKYLYLNKIAIRDDKLRSFIIGKDDFDYAKHTGRDESLAIKRREKFLQTKESKNFMEWEECMTSPFSGLTYYHNRRISPVFDKNGALEMMVGFAFDITERKRLEEDLKQSEAKFKGAFEHSPVGMALVDIDGKYLEVNDQLCEIFGYSPQELKSLTFQEMIYVEDLEIELGLKHDLDLLRLSQFSSEKRFVSKNKAIIWAYFSVAIEKNNENKDYYIVQIKDITERKEIEQQNKLLIEENNKNRAKQLEEAENMYLFLVKNTVDLVCLHKLDTTFQYISPSVVDILGYTSEEIVGKSPLDFTHPEDLEYLKDSFAGFIDGKLHETTVARFINKQGKYVWLETKANIVNDKNIKKGFQTSSRDITTRKEEEEIIEKTLAKERELNELRSNLVSTVSHEFRTPMTTIRTSAELIAMYIEGKNFEKVERVDKQLNTIIEEIDRIVELMNSVLTISRNDAGKTNFRPIAFDLKQLCFDVIETSFDKEKDGKVCVFFKGENFLVYADKNLMEYSIFNLLNNAFKYSKDSKNVVVKLSATRSKVILQIIDQGIGIPKEDQHKLFNTFFRASNSNGIPGTGLGLYIVKTFTEKNSGTIRLESVLGKGTKIILKFPLQKT